MNRDPDCSTVPGVPAGAGADPSEWGPEGLHVLVVEDNEEEAASMALLLRVSGHKVQVTADGPAALEAAKHGLPDMVLLDIGLPGMDGYGVARWITEQPYDKNPLLIAVTGLGREEDRRQSAAAGIDLHLVKPVEAGLLQGLLSRFQAIIM
jgi:CheY-like chemotaxis protein